MKSTIWYKICMHHFTFALVFIHYYFSWIEDGENIPFRPATLLVMAKLSKPQPRKKKKKLCKPFAFSALQVLSLPFSSQPILHPSISPPSFLNLIFFFLISIVGSSLLLHPPADNPALYFL